LLVVLVGMIAVELLSACVASLPRPNLLFMMADQLRHDAQGVVWAGAKTPSLDALAASGVRFSAAYSSTPTCTPARAALLTGQSPWNHGMLGFGKIAKQSLV
jgi:arylsulfatase A-like enzyme